MRNTAARPKPTAAERAATAVARCRSRRAHRRRGTKHTSHIEDNGVSWFQARSTDVAAATTVAKRDNCKRIETHPADCVSSALRFDSKARRNGTPFVPEAPRET